MAKNELDLPRIVVEWSSYGRYTGKHKQYRIVAVLDKEGGTPSFALEIAEDTFDAMGGLRWMYFRDLHMSETATEAMVLGLAEKLAQQSVQDLLWGGEE